MSCDIHMVLEKQHTDGRWVGVNDFPHLNEKAFEFGGAPPIRIFWHARNRNYSLFARLAGVRGEGPSPKGEPDGISDLARMRLDEWDGDAHSVTWYPLKEALTIFNNIHEDERKVDIVTDQLLGTKQNDSAAYWFGLDKYELQEAEYRLVIWFDN